MSLLFKGKVKHGHPYHTPIAVNFKFFKSSVWPKTILQKCILSHFFAPLGEALAGHSIPIAVWPIKLLFELICSQNLALAT